MKILDDIPSEKPVDAWEILEIICEYKDILELMTKYKDAGHRDDIALHCFSCCALNSRIA